jgi:hypothetical protein
MYKFLCFIISLSCCSACFGNCVPSSRSSSVPAELQANLNFLLIKFCVVCGCAYNCGRNINFKWPCNSDGTDEFHADGTLMPKQAEEQLSEIIKLIIIYAFVSYS